MKRGQIVLVMVAVGIPILYFSLFGKYSDPKGVILRDGESILMVRDDEVMLLTILNQTLSKRKADYNLLYRSDGVISFKKSFNSQEIVEKKGEIASSSALVIGSFKLVWEPKTENIGNLYLNFYRSWNARYGVLKYAVVSDTSNIEKVNYQILDIPHIFSW